MKIAFCFSGMIRDIEKTYSHWNKIFNSYDCDIYGHFWDISDKNQEDNLLNFEKHFKPKKVELENFDIFKESTLDIMMKNIKVHPSLNIDTINWINKGTLISQYYKVYKANQLSMCSDYDIIVRCRTDFYPEDTIVFEKNNCINLLSGGLIYVAGWKNSDAHPDVLAYGNRKIMNYFSSLFFYIMSYVKSGYYFFPSEYFLKAHLGQKDIILKEIPHKIFTSEGVFWNSIAPLVDHQTCMLNRLETPDPQFSFYNEDKTI